MKSNTLTQIENLLPGDIFYLPGHAEKFKKLKAKPVSSNKHLYKCLAEKINSNSLEPRPFRGNEDVVFLRRLIP